ncbi:MAG: hypothetical protein WCO12_00450 [bacterium]
MKKKYVSLLVVTGLLSSFIFSLPALADTVTAGNAPHRNFSGDNKRGVGVHRQFGVFGTVASISGTTITVNSQVRPNGTSTSVVYTVDASNSKVTKDNATSSVSNIVVGDKIIVQGKVDGTNVVATNIRDGVSVKGNMPDGQKRNPNFQGNGQPVIGGNITAISGTTLTVTNKGGVVYTVDATNAFVQKDNATSTLSSVAVNDIVVVQGTVNGTSIAASSVIDHGVAPASSTENKQEKPKGFFGGIANFFSRFLGF